MALFNRKKTQTISELEDYYATKNTRTGMAWLMAFLSLFITVLVIAGLFFGGRWIYRTFTDNDSDSTIATTSGSTNEKPTSGSVDVDTAPETTPSTTPSEDFPSVVTDEAASTDVPNTDRLAARSNALETPTTGDSSELPNTGAGELLLFVPLVAVVAGYLFSRNRQLQ